MASHAAPVVTKRGRHQTLASRCVPSMSRHVRACDPQAATASCRARRTSASAGLAARLSVALAVDRDLHKSRELAPWPCLRLEAKPRPYAHTSADEDSAKCAWQHRLATSDEAMLLVQGEQLQTLARHCAISASGHDCPHYVHAATPRCKVRCTSESAGC